MIEALQKDGDRKGSAVIASTILGVVPDDPDEPDEECPSVSIVTFNDRSELSMMIFDNARDVTEFCAALQAASDAVFADGDLQAEIELEN